MLLRTLDRKTSSLAVCIIFDLLILSFSASSSSCVLCHHMLIICLKCWVDLVSRWWSHRAGNNDDLIWNFDWQWAYNKIRVRSRKDWVLVEDALTLMTLPFCCFHFTFELKFHALCSLLHLLHVFEGALFGCRMLRMCVLLLHDGRLDYFCWREFGRSGRDCYTFSTARRTKKPNFWVISLSVNIMRLRLLSPWAQTTWKLIDSIFTLRTSSYRTSLAG